MRRFEDSDGRVWEVVAGRESWGALFALFVPLAGPDPVRQTQLPADSWEDAARILGAADEVDLREMLEKSLEKDLG